MNMKELFKKVENLMEHPKLLYYRTENVKNPAYPTDPSDFRRYLEVKTYTRIGEWFRNKPRILLLGFNALYIAALWAFVVLFCVPVSFLMKLFGKSGDY